MVVGWNPVAITSDIATVSSEEFLDIQATISCRFTLKHVRDMITTYSPVITFHTLRKKGEIKTVSFLTRLYNFLVP